MFDFHEKRKIRRILFSKVSIGVLILFSTFILISAYERFVIEREMAQKLNLKRIELDAINGRAESLRAKVEHLENERGIEEEIRKRFDVAKEGEQVVIIIDEPETGEATRTPAEDTERTNVQEERHWLDAFKLW